MDDAQGFVKISRVGGEIEPRQGHGGDRSSEKERGRALAFEAFAQDDDADGRRGAQGQQARVAEERLDFGQREDQREGDDAEQRADPREPAAKVKFKRRPGRRNRGHGRQRVTCRGLPGGNRGERQHGGRGRGDGRKRGVRRQRRQGRECFRSGGRARAGFQRAQLGVEPFQRLLEVPLLTAQREEKVAVFGGHAPVTMSLPRRAVKLRKMTFLRPARIGLM